MSKNKGGRPNRPGKNIHLRYGILHKLGLTAFDSTEEINRRLEHASLLYNQQCLKGDSNVT